VRALNIRLGLRQDARGVTTLVSVMILFFVMALVAAFTNRNLVVEQRVAQTYHELSLASEASSQAVERALTLLNSGKMNASCLVDPAGPYTFRDWLFDTSASGVITIVPGVASATANPADAPFPMVCDRVRGADWSCQCPADFAPVRRASGNQDPQASNARIRSGVSAGRIDVVAHSCASGSATCEPREENEAVSNRREQALFLMRALKMPPTSALVAKGAVNLGTGMKVVHNEASAGGVALQAGGKVTGARNSVSGPAGTPSSTTIVDEDALLGTLTNELFFRRFFGMAMVDHFIQPAMRELVCTGQCADRIRALVDAGHQLIRYDGNLTLDQDVEMGSLTRPIILLVDGDLRISGPMKFYGLLYVNGALNWTNSSASPSLIQGSAIVAGDVVADAGAVALFDLSTMEALKFRVGSFIRLPGGLWLKR
jgi:hypothetical protein